MTNESSPPLPSPPFYTHIPNINNFRLATHSLTTKSNTTILRPDLLFRSAEVSKLDLDGWKAVHALGISHVFDLRSKPEVDKDDSNLKGHGGLNGTLAMEQASLHRTWTPIFEESDYSPERLAERYVKYMDEDVKGFVEAYSEFLASGGPAYGTILRHLASLPPPDSTSEEKVGLLIHCTAGKDRTGMFFGLLFDFLGVPREQIAEEYHLTQMGLANVREEVVARLMRSPAFQNHMAAQASGLSFSAADIAKSIAGEDVGRVDGGKEISPEILEKGRQAALRMVSSRKESMLGALQMLDERFGGAEKYMREICRLGDAELEGIRRNLLAGGTEGSGK